MYVLKFNMLNKFKPKSEFSRNVLTLMTGTTIAQAIPIAISPILTRIYTPKDFGIFALYMSVASILSVVATGRYELAIMLPKKDEDAVNIVVLSILISFFVSFIALLIIFFFNAPITSLLGDPKIANWLYFIPLTVLMTGLYQSFNYWSNRKKEYRQLASSRIIKSTTISSTNLFMGFSGFGSGGLIGSTILGQGVATLFLGRLIFKDDREIFSKIKKLKVFALAKKYIDYPKKSSIGALFNTISYQAEYILFSIFFLFKDVGIYYFVNKIINIPKQFLSGSIWQSFLSHSQETKEYVLISLKSKQEKVIKYSILPMLSSIFIFPQLFIIIFGENWSEATEYFIPLILAMHINFVVASFSLFVIINRPDMEMKFNFLLAGFKVLGIYVAYKVFNNILVSIYVLSFIQIVMFIYLGNWNYIQLGEKKFFFTTLYMKYLLLIFAPMSFLFVISLYDSIFLNFITYLIVNFIFFKWIQK